MSSAPDMLRSALEDRLRFEELIADISSRFVSLDLYLLDEAIIDAQRRLGEMLGFDRSILFQTSGADSPARLTHAWMRPEFADRLPGPESYSESAFPLISARIRRGEMVSFASVDELPRDSIDRASMIAIGTQAHVSVPLIVSGQVVGALTFATLREARVWPFELIQRLRLVGQVFAAAIVRKRAEEELRRSIDDRLTFEATVADVASQFINLDSDLIDGVIQRAQQQIVELLDLDRSSLYQFSQPEGPIALTHTWVRPEFAQAVASPSGYRFHQYPAAASRLLKGELFSFASVNELEEPDRSSFMRFGTKSSLAVPLIVAGRVIGALAFAAHRTERRWPDDTVRRLNLIGHVFASALARQRTERALRATLEENVRLRERLTQENVYLQREIRELAGPSEIAGQSSAIRRLLDEIDQVAPTPATVLILGETGTGKELIASAIHERSPRSGRTMVRVNCAAIPTTLIESELFGHEKGAYTGALTRQAGRFEVADGSTILLDEIGELPMEVQVKLLRVLQERQIERLGSTRPTRIDARIIASTHRDLERAVADGTFREDLYYRLNVFPIRVPSLRERSEDIPGLAWAFVEEFARVFGKRIESIPTSQMQALQEYAWPGNVRELRNVVERAVIVSTGPRLAIEPPRRTPSSSGRSVKLADVERDHILAVLERAQWRVRGAGGAAEALGLKPSTLEGRMVKLDIRRPRS